MNKILPYYSLLSIVFLIGCLQAFFVGVPKTLKHHPVVNHLLDKPEGSALLLIKNGEVIIDQNTEASLPLAGISKMVIALVFAEQAVEHRVDPEKRIALQHLERFYIGGRNYQAWKIRGEAEGWIQENQVPLKYIAQGVLRFSANTNADFLMHYLGLSTINSWLEEKKLFAHAPLIPFNASAIFCHNLENLPPQKFLTLMDTLSQEAYIQKVLSIQNRLAQGDSLRSKSLHTLKINDLEALKMWSDRLPKARPKDYAHLTHWLLNKSLSDKELARHITFLFEEWAFDDHPGLDQQFSRIGFKTGSTGFLLNTILYLQDKKGNQAQVVLFMTGLSPNKHMLINRLSSNFVFDLATNDNFVEDIHELLAPDL